MTSAHRTPPRVAEARAVEAALDAPGERILATTLGRAQAALALAAARRAARVTCWFLDDYQRCLAADHVAAANLELVTSADAPPAPVDLAVVPLVKRGEAELARDLLQSACQRLALGGRLVTAVDNPADHWVREQLGAWFANVRVVSFGDARAYVARKTIEPRKWKDFRCRFAFRDQGRLIQAVSRPGVFAHRRIDPGARQLLAAADPPLGARILDIGCGSGAVGLALAARDPTCSVRAVDSHARAVESTLAGAALNGLTNLTAELNATGEYGATDDFDLALANPPYYANFEIAARFLAAARRSLKPDGDVLVVTKRPDWYEHTMPETWSDIRVLTGKRYAIVSARKPR
jgi:16S rRNA (guanine1207-N2)-methyltransferase